MAASRRTIRSVALTLALGLVGAGCAMREMAAKYEAEQKLVSGHIKTFDDLDYNVFPARSGPSSIAATRKTLSCTGPTGTPPRESTSILRISRQCSCGRPTPGSRSTR